jgi:hypothetical protein
MRMLCIASDRGDVEIHEVDLPLTEQELKKLCISRAEFDRCFAEGVSLMERVVPGELTRPIAEGGEDACWHVQLCSLLGAHVSPYGLEA